MKYIFIIISFISTTLWKLAKLRGITPLYNSSSLYGYPLIKLFCQIDILWKTHIYIMLL